MANRSGGRKGAAFAAVLGMILLAGIHLIWPHLIPAIFTTIARPFWRAEFAVESGSLLSREALLSENEELKRELADQNTGTSIAKSLEEENAQLRFLLGESVSSGDTVSASSSKSIENNKVRNNLSSRDTYKLAAVLKRPPYSPYDILVIDGGVDLDFVPGDLVYAAKDIPIGEIVETLGQTSKVILFSSPGKSYEVLIGQSNIQATAVGRGGGQYSAELPRSANVSSGDFVYAPILGERPLGVVSAVSGAPTETFERVYFASPVNISQLRWVLVRHKTK